MALAVQLAHVNVQLKNRKRNKQEEMTTAGSANDLWQMTEKSGNDMGSILSNIALRDDHSGYYTSVKGQTLTKAGGYNRQSSGYFMDGHLTPLGEYLERFCKGPFIYYVSTLLGFLDPPPPLRKHVFCTENKQ